MLTVAVSLATLGAVEVGSDSHWEQGYGRAKRCLYSDDLQGLNVRSPEVQFLSIAHTESYWVWSRASRYRGSAAFSDRDANWRYLGVEGVTGRNGLSS